MRIFMHICTKVSVTPIITPYYTGVTAPQRCNSVIWCNSYTGVIAELLHRANF